MTKIEKNGIYFYDGILWFRKMCNKINYHDYVQLTILVNSDILVLIMISVLL